MDNGLLLVKIDCYKILFLVLILIVMDNGLLLVDEDGNATGDWS